MILRFGTACAALALMVGASPATAQQQAASAAVP
ncbi:hypothetical protein HD841_001375, partial [Sphingomonas melonis]|nr:hypothetical protein [Sphingomonas melonis]